MSIDVIDSATAMAQILDAPEDQRADLVRSMWEPMADMYRYRPGGYDLSLAHRQSFGFAWEDRAEVTQEALSALVQADAWNRIEIAIKEAIDAIHNADPEATIPDLKVLLILGDSTNPHFMDEIKGSSALGGMSGFITITVWPTEEVLNRLEAIAAHELHHNIRYSPGGVIWNPMTVTVGEQVVSEGLADVFASEHYGDVGYSHFVADDVYENDEVLAKVVSGLDTTGMRNFTAWIHGDASARLFGLEPVGLPTGAGYAAGTRLVRAYLDATGRTATESVRTPSKEIIEIGCDWLGLTR